MDLLRCIRCGAQYPMELEASWGRNNASDGHGRDPHCTALVDAPHAARAMDPETRVHSVVAQEVCGGRLHFVPGAPDDAPVQEIGRYGPNAERGPRGVTKPARK